MSLKHGCQTRFPPGKGYIANCYFSLLVVLLCLSVLVVLWLVLLLQQSGDVHPNPSPSSVTSDTSSASAASIPSFIDFVKHLSFVHYNVQSVYPKLDVLFADLCDLDILAFSGTWLNSSIKNDDLLLQLYHSPERKDRIGDSHGGVMIYVRDTIHYIRRRDLEPQGIECLWIELTLKHKHVLFGLFYRPPNSTAPYFSSVEDSIHLAVDTGFPDILVTEDFNFNMLNIQSSYKIKDLCEQHALKQTINEPTHFTEHSSSLLDIILTTNENHLIFTGVGDPFLAQEIRYHCPVYGIFNFSKPKHKSFVRHTWSFEQGDCNFLRGKASLTNWDNLYDADINKYVQNISNHIIMIAKECIPNRKTRFNSDEPAWR